MYGSPKGRRAAPPSSLVLSLAFALLLAACGGGDDVAEDSGGSETTAEEVTVSDRGDELDEVFQDDLEDDENGWGETQNDEFSTSFTDDGYSVGLIGGSPRYYAYADAGPLAVADSSTTVEVQEIEGITNRDFGVTCRLSRTGPLAYYTLTVNSETGAYSIARWSDDTPDVLEEGEDDAIEGIEAGDTTEVTGTCLGEGDGEPVELGLTVDGREVATATDDEGLAAGITGLSVVTFDGEDRDLPVVFTGIEIRGDEVDSDLEFEDDFSDPESGFEEFSEEGVGGTSTYEDGGYLLEVTESLRVLAPVRAPFPVGTATVDIQADLTDIYAGICLAGPGGMYEFATSAGGYGSLGFYPDGGEFVLIDEASEVYEDDGTVRLTAGWNTDGSSTNLDIYADGEVVASVRGDQSLTSFDTLFLCVAVASTAPEGSTASVVYDNLVVTE